MMAFHVACPITCKKICFCKLGFPQKLQTEKARAVFLDEAVRLSRFVADPLGLLTAVDDKERGGEKTTVQVLVPKVVKPPPPLPVAVPVSVSVSAAAASVVPVVVGDGGDGIEAAAEGSAQIKRVVLQKNAAVASLAAEDFARRFESGDLPDASRGIDGEEHGQSGVNVMCRMCFYGEVEGSERARRMLSCKCCGKKYHRSCIKSWAQHRDLFHWSSWTCPSCRICELCRRTGDPNKFLFCKRCDGAYHCYCQHPPHKNVSAGPYLCTKHTRCHSCGSNVPGNGLSVRWFLGYTCCDACGRLFVKGNYCPVCLKVYRDSESTPMVCCDICQRWVHCECDGISDERYQQYQADGNLQYQCATCRGECYEVKDLEDAVRELWSRRDEADRDLIANERAAAGLPTQEEIFSITPYSDDEEDGPTVLKNEFGRSLKFSMKGMVDKSPKKMKEYGKKSNKNSFKKKEYQTPLTSKIKSLEACDDYHVTPTHELALSKTKNNYAHSHKHERIDVLSAPGARNISHPEGISSINQPGAVKHKFGDDHSMSSDRTAKTLRIKSNQAHGQVTAEDIGKSAGKSKTVKGPKLVIHLGSRNKNVAHSPRSDDASSCQKEQELTTSNGSADTNHQRKNKLDSDAKLGYSLGDKVENQIQLKSLAHGPREGASEKVGKIRSEFSDIKLKYERRNTAGGSESIHKENMRVVLGKRSSDESQAAAIVGTVKEVPAARGNKVYIRKHPEGSSNVSKGSKDDRSQVPSVSQPIKDSKPLLKLKLKNPYHENQSSWVPLGDQEKTLVKGQRSKRKRPSFMERSAVKDDEDFNQGDQDESMNEIMDANWILKKLGKDAVGKRVEVHMPSDNSWHKGVVANFIEGTSILTVDLDDGRLKTIELGKQGIRFVSQQKRPRP